MDNCLWIPASETFPPNQQYNSFTQTLYCFYSDLEMILKANQNFHCCRFVFVCLFECACGITVFGDSHRLNSLAYARGNEKPMSRKRGPYSSHNHLDSPRVLQRKAYGPRKLNDHLEVGLSSAVPVLGTHWECFVNIILEKSLRICEYTNKFIITISNVLDTLCHKENLRFPLHYSPRKCRKCKPII